MSWGEFIELHDLRSDGERIELTRSPCSPPRLERTNALRISPGRVPDLLSRVGIIRVLSSTQDPQIIEEKGEGHNFQPCSHAQPTWCDLCGDFIWGLYKQSLRCISELALVTYACLCTCGFPLCMCGMGVKKVKGHRLGYCLLAPYVSLVAMIFNFLLINWNPLMCICGLHKAFVEQKCAFTSKNCNPLTQIQT